MPEVEPQTERVDSLAPASTATSELSNNQSQVNSPSSSAPVLTQDKAAIAEPNEKAIAPRQGTLRVGNLTEHPVRVALLIKKAGKAAAADLDDQSSYEPPAHWDFEPGEGSINGLIVSLPNRSIKLKKGDILVAFAQDGSRRYWGPYVVGETSTPNWSPKVAEWELTLEP
ncbi:MAG: hypothetical protein HC866_04885 [Leptolyngbyaceae cyanobacterium RU_5_1]|nr:hypothetical protein [Leptolyngbyaceae cyanobacterium RU_5_1]